MPAVSTPAAVSAEFDAFDDPLEFVPDAPPALPPSRREVAFAFATQFVALAVGAAVFAHSALALF